MDEENNTYGYLKRDAMQEQNNSTIYKVWQWKSVLENFKTYLNNNSFFFYANVFDTVTDEQCHTVTVKR